MTGIDQKGRPVAERYDPNSKGYVEDFKDASKPTDDVWATLVAHITGFPVPDRTTVFDSLRSEQGGKLFRMEITDHLIGSLVKDRSGFLVDKGQDYDIWFFNRGKSNHIKQARIVFEGRVKQGDEIVFANSGLDIDKDHTVRQGNTFTDYNGDKMDSRPLAQYMNGPRTALRELLGGGTGGGARFSGLEVPGPDMVDLKSFKETGESFDYAAKFFRDHAEKLKKWEDDFGRDDASWKGEAAEVFRGLLKKIRENYDSYVETFAAQAGAGGDTGTGEGNTVYSRALSLGSQYLQRAAADLLQAWRDWTSSGYYDPHQVLRYVLDELARWVDEHNIAETDIKAEHRPFRSLGSKYEHVPKAGFLVDHPEYGDLADIASWTKVGDKAVELWSQGIDKYLGEPAKRVQSELNNHFLDLSKDFTENVPEPKSTGTAAGEYNNKEVKNQNDEINKQNEENRAFQKQLQKEQDEQRAKDREYQKQLQNEQDKQREEDREYAEEVRNEQKKQREEDRGIQDELRAEQEKQREEDRAYQEKVREEQRREQEEAKREAEEQAKALEKDLGGLNGPGGASELNLGSLDDALNNPVTESSGTTEDLNRLTASPALATQNLGNLGSLNGGPGGKNNAAVNDAITQNLGSLGDVNGGAGSSLETPTGGTTQLDGSQITSDFPDGSSTSFDPDTGTLTTTHPDGTTTTQNLGDGARVTNPDGSVTSLGDDGKLTTTFPDGTTQTVDPTTGQATTTDPDGRTTTENLGNLGNLNGGNGPGDLGDLGDLGDINSDLPTESVGDLGNLGNLNGDQPGLETPTGGHTAFDGGDFTTTFPDGSKATFDPDNGQLTTTDPDGSTKTTDLTHGAKVTNPDGSVTELDNGQLTTTFPDGSTQVIDPDTGVATVTDPQGKTETIDLKDLNSAGGPGGSDLLDDLGTGGGGDRTTSRDVPLSELGLGGGNGSSAASDGGLSGASTEAFGAAAAPLSDGAAGSAGTPLGPAAGTPGAPGMPGSPGMPMGGGMGGMGAGGGDKGNSERVRAVLVDAAEESERRNRRRRSPWNRQEDSDTFLAPASRVATTGGDSPEEEAEPGRRPTSSADYLEEDADVWGTEEGGTPAVIGR
ncbi:AAWKG family protein [Streptomyces sp. NPDC047108]|uniref:AAWKG family protein n=1 Tax=Streptomyces sp. NPDC047108 TaxID=3155025 RepID=UPI0033EDDEA0